MSGATGSHILVTREWGQPLKDSLFHTGSSRWSLGEATEQRRFNLVPPDMLQLDVGGHDFSVLLPRNDTTPIPNESWYNFYIDDAGFVTPISPKQRRTSELSSIIRSQVEEIVIGANSKLEQRLSQFGSDRPNQEPVSESTIRAAKALVSWLCHQSDTVSATVSNDGILSIATVFPNEVRLYVEIERDGITEAAVTRERRYARDITSNTVDDLTPEVILAAVESV